MLTYSQAPTIQLSREGMMQAPAAVTDLPDLKRA